MRLVFMFACIVLFGTAGLVIFIHLQDPVEIIPQQTPGVKYNAQRHRNDCPPGGSQAGRVTGHKSGALAKVPPLGSRGPGARSREQPLDSLALLVGEQAKPGPEGGRGQPRQRRRRLLIKKTPIVIALNSSAVTLAQLRPQEAGAAEGRWQRLYRVQRERKKTMRDTCAKYKSGGRRAVTPYHVSRIFVEDKYRVLYCEVPKAGCSNWKRVLMVLGGLASATRDIQHNTVHYGNTLKRLDAFDRQGISHRLSTYTKMLFVREPFERLVSAFRDKFEHPNSYYHPVFGKAILARYRENATREALRTGSGVRFSEFSQYLLDVHRPVGMDIHWDHVNRLCSPCLIDYDFVGKFESMEEDANFFLRLVGAPRNLTFPSFKDRHSDEERTTTSIARRYFAQLSPLQRQRTYDFYYMDYLMFNYSKPFDDLY
ncbi:carbohydrate sulfotransferase 8 [Sarcophilus harrisii]|uniref:Carbohydrate sulfotransferase n=1 Tax=Sarcophilus harrisii TaxID=9305 RepID=G3WE73_SARHA|nr:carbohydrate sulfotransferase 8 [Sarcophilus harrisii]XP_031810230.1 carbohydrate sulfotransferase 8 [Sarcophilus harrisii]